MEKKRIGKAPPLVWKVEAPLAGLLIILLFLQNEFTQLHWLYSILCIALLVFGAMHFLRHRTFSYLHSIDPKLGYLGVLLCLSPYILASIYLLNIGFKEVFALAFGIGLIGICLYLYLQKDNEHVASYYFIYLLFLSQLYSYFMQ
ncbi:MAG: hypothetical protein CMO34_02175 [Verrucomicrobia bacterium]|nr:hypothetical protein [Verrucomicrobiota bacterium]|tara:strand:+ start:50 stop:484 length:435 start_codon:yes stop_codon:yes gene_type:complete